MRCLIRWSLACALPLFALGSCECGTPVEEPDATMPRKDSSIQPTDAGNQDTRRPDAWRPDSNTGTDTRRPDSNAGTDTRRPDSN
ncbi:MAG: hypothetical protein JXR83_20125, partial [Deltaproteobacteria bacterium]|nr:hypothetical protein [Deltaproteobacteria bacterium]